MQLQCSELRNIAYFVYYFLMFIIEKQNIFFERFLFQDLCDNSYLHVTNSLRTHVLCNVLFIHRGYRFAALYLCTDSFS